jgi:hypothetical protein
VAHTHTNTKKGLREKRETFHSCKENTIKMRGSFSTITTFKHTSPIRERNGNETSSVSPEQLNGDM